MNIKKTAEMIFLSITLLMLIILATGALRMAPHKPSKASDNSRNLSFDYELEGRRGTVIPPHSFKYLAPRTKVVLTTQLTPQPGENLYIKSIYAPLKVYANNVLLYECGQYGSYPTVMKDPPTTVAIISLPDADHTIELRLEYLSPMERTILHVPSITLGPPLALIARSFWSYGFSLLFSILLLFIGICLLLISVMFLRIQSGASLFHLGLFAMAVGGWGLGECNLTVFLLPYPSFLYLISFVGLFTLTIPLLKFGLLMLNPHKGCLVLLTATRAVLCACVLGALVLQIMGIMGLHRSMYLFHIIIPISMIILGICVLWEYFRHRNPVTKRFIVPGLILALSAVLETLNYQLRFTHVMSLFFQMGMLLFVLSLGLIAGIYSHQAIHTKMEKTRLELEVATICRALDMQKEQYSMLVKNAETVKKQRHDLRHQLAVIKGLVYSDETDRLREYLNRLIADIPLDKQTFPCENLAVSAITRYYLSLAQTLGIDVSIRLVVPSENGHVQDSDLCIIVGNLLENAIDACKNMVVGKRFIKITSRVQYDTLTFAMDNSFDGAYEQKENIFYSRKREGVGIGLSSIRTVAKKYNGAARFEVKGHVFLSSVYIHTGNLSHKHDGLAVDNNTAKPY